MVRVPASFRALGHGPFMLLWVGQTLSRLGDALYGVALAWWVLQETGSATAMGTALICAYVPMLLFLLVGGVTVDRLPRFRIMLASDALSGAVVAIIAVLAATGHLSVWHVYVASLLFGTASAFFEPAYIAGVPDLVPADLLQSANAVTLVGQRVANVVGPAAGAFVVSLGGTSVAFAANALSFYLSAACLLPLVGRSQPMRSGISDDGGQSSVHDLGEGIHMVLSSPWLWVTIAIASLGNVTHSGPIAVAMPFLVQEHRDGGVQFLGLVYSAMSLGTVFAALWLGRYRRIRHRGMLAYGAWGMGGLMILLMGLPIPVVGVLGAALINGAMMAAFGLIWTVTLQELVPRAVLGRVASIDQLGSFAMLPAGYWLTGWATEHLGAPLVFIVGGTLTLILMIVGLAHPAVRRLD
jgi:MFS family permease